MRQINAIIKLRRDDEINFNKIKDSFIPANGEVVLVDTTKGLRSKIGDGIKTFSQLSYTDEKIINNINNIVIYGYLMNETFFTDSTYTKVLPRELNKIYIDNNSKVIYYYDGTNYISINDTLPMATDVVAGISKLYQNCGQNTDGSISQKVVTDKIQAISLNIDSQDNECLILDLPQNQ